MCCSVSETQGGKYTAGVRTGTTGKKAGLLHTIPPQQHPKATQQIYYRYYFSAPHKGSISAGPASARPRLLEVSSDPLANANAQSVMLNNVDSPNGLA